MTNEQLYILMRSMLGELDAAIDKVRALMPEGVPQIEYKDILGRPSAFEFEAIVPLNELWETWNDRAELALGKREDKA